MTIYAATTNPGKLREFAACASGDGVEVLPLPRLAEMTAPEEDADSFLGNAELKAVAYSRTAGAAGLMVFADDSGLEVDALGGMPGVRSARFAEDREFAEESADTVDGRNNACVVELLERLPHEPRTARFRCALVLARDGEVLLRAEGAVEGEMLLEQRGEDGFGYDPLFLLPERGLTMAEVSREEKWEVGHRGKAFRELLRGLREVVAR